MKKNPNEVPEHEPDQQPDEIPTTPPSEVPEIVRNQFFCRKSKNMHFNGNLYIK